jgi:hypothetical protein
VVAPVLQGLGRGPRPDPGSCDPGDRTHAERRSAKGTCGAIALRVSSLHPSIKRRTAGRLPARRTAQDYNAPHRNGH